jgi:hypothetical protein
MAKAVDRMIEETLAVTVSPEGAMKENRCPEGDG